MKNQQGGFTLVEIAIVLVIIGLLLGGVLRGGGLGMRRGLCGRGETPWALVRRNDTAADAAKTQGDPA